jgi:hypothetical protein
MQHEGKARPSDPGIWALVGERMIAMAEASCNAILRGIDRHWSIANYRLVDAVTIQKASRKYSIATISFAINSCRLWQNEAKEINLFKSK